MKIGSCSRGVGAGKKGDAPVCGMRTTGHRRAGFTLLEIMISVLILALGLLGLGAVFPVVIRSQRIAQDETYGAMAADTALATLKSMNFESSLTPQGPNLQPRNIWKLMRGYYDNSAIPPAYRPSRLGTAAYQHGEWYVPPIDNIQNSVELGAPNAQNRMNMPVSVRLYPQGSPNLAPPQFVWDLAVQRIDDGIPDTGPTGNNAATDSLRVAVFVRRLDLRMRPQMGRTIYAAIADSAIPNAQRLRPVGANATTGLPTGDGTGDYAAPFTLQVEVRNDGMGRLVRDRIYLETNASAEEWAMLRQVGQKVIDNLGNIHTVTGSVQNGTERYVTLEAPLPPSVSTLVWPDGKPVFHQIVLTAKVPAAVKVYEVRE